MKLERLAHQAEHEADCVAAATGRVRTFLLRTPCTSLDRLLLAVGDGHENAAVVSVVRVGFRSRKQAAAFDKTSPCTSRCTDRPHRTELSTVDQMADPHGGR